MEKVKAMYLEDLRKIVDVKCLDVDSKRRILNASLYGEKVVVFFDSRGAVKFVDNVFQSNETFID